MPKIRADMLLDPDQGSHQSYYLTCPKCRQKLADVEHLQGMVIVRFKCRRCGSYIKADLVGVE
jgi:PHP family Zn ribbon phosphoesterase